MAGFDASLLVFCGAFPELLILSPGFFPVAGFFPPTGLAGATGVEEGITVLGPGPTIGFSGFLPVPFLPEPGVIPLTGDAPEDPVVVLPVEVLWG